MGHIVIPSEAEESLTISEMEISRDVSTSLDMTQMRSRIYASRPWLKLPRGLFDRQSLRTEMR